MIETTNKKIELMQPEVQESDSKVVLFEKIAETMNESETNIKEDVQLTVLEHGNMLNALLNELKPIDFHERAGLEINEPVTKKQFLIITNEEILETAKRRKWSLCMSDGFLYCFNGVYWRQLSKSDLIKFLGDGALKLGVDVFDAKYHKFKDELHKQFLSTAYLPRPERFGNEVIINLKNGTFVVKPENQYLKPFEKSDFLTYQLPFDYNEDAAAPFFQKYLDRVLPDKEQQMILAEYIGYLFTKQKTLKLEKALVLYGRGANGKSVFFDIVNALLGVENVSNYGLQSLTNESGYQRAKLSDKLLNYASEISPNMDSTLFKQLVSGEAVEARLPYGEPFVMNDYAKFIFNTNTLPKDVEQNEAFYRRFLLIEFGVTIPEKDRDPGLAQKIIQNDLPGIFNWVLDGLKRLLQNQKFTESKAVEEAVKEYRRSSDTVCLFLDDKNLVPGIKEEPLQRIYKEYKQYCTDFTYRACGLRVFAERLRNLDFDVQRKSQGNVVYIGTKLYHEPTSDTLTA